MDWNFWLWNVAFVAAFSLVINMVTPVAQNVLRSSSEAYRNSVERRRKREQNYYMALEGQGTLKQGVKLAVNGKSLAPHPRW